MLATRNEIFRLRDTKGTGTADEKTRLAFLESKGDSPARRPVRPVLRLKENRRFGFGENLGEPYKLIGADGKTISGGGEGGHIFHMTKDGKDLRTVANGFWNPFGLCRDIYGRLFAVDNDPDSRPPCRLVHVVEGGDYGFQFRYGRGGRHPFQAWNGELPGTLPYVCGVGEAPCAVMAYESDGLPDEYRGDLLVTSWADHHLERYTLEPKGASFTSKTKVVIQGGKDFRPVGMALAPDGSLFLTDWVRRDYNLHGKGAVWHVRWKDHKAAARPTDPVDAIKSMHRPLREAAARLLTESEDGKRVLFKGLKNAEVRVRASCIQYLATKDLEGLGEESFRLLAVLRQGEVHCPFSLIDQTLPLSTNSLLIRAADESVLGGIRNINVGDAAYLRALDGILERASDPFVRQAVIERLAKAEPKTLKTAELPRNLQNQGPAYRIGWFLVDRTRNQPTERLAEYLTSSDEGDIRFLTAKWIADERLRDYYPLLSKAIQDPKLNTRLYLAYATAMGKRLRRSSRSTRFASRPSSCGASRATRRRRISACRRFV